MGLAQTDLDADYCGMKIPDELLSAFINGELEDADRQRVERAIEQDQRIALRVARKRALLDEVSRRRVHALPASSSQPRPYGRAQIIDLASFRAERAQIGKRRRNLKSPRLVLTATLVVGLVVGLICGAAIVRLTADSGFTQYRGGVLVARGVLARALNEQLGGSTPLGTEIRIGATYRSKIGNYCRSFSTTASQPISGFACRVRDQWQLQTLASGAPTSAALSEFGRNLGNPVAASMELQVRARNWK
jgi:hypothetical protein